MCQGLRCPTPALIPLRHSPLSGSLWAPIPGSGAAGQPLTASSSMPELPFPPSPTPAPPCFSWASGWPAWACCAARLSPRKRQLDLSDAVGIDVTFHDNGDTAAVPDTGTTGSLFGLSLAGLAFLRRNVC